MHRLHVTIVSALLAATAVLGAVALARTTGLGNASRHANDAAVAAKTKQLAAYEAKLHQALAAKTPALPPLPKSPSRSGASPATATPQQKVIYRRPPPVVVVRHASQSDDGFEEAAGGGDD